MLHLDGAVASTIGSQGNARTEHGFQDVGIGFEQRQLQAVGVLALRGLHEVGAECVVLLDVPSRGLGDTLFSEPAVINEQCVQRCGGVGRKGGSQRCPIEHTTGIRAGRRPDDG